MGNTRFESEIRRVLGARLETSVELTEKHAARTLERERIEPDVREERRGRHP